MDCITESLLTMTMDVYRQSDLQDANTGAIVKTWNYHRTLECVAKGFISNSGTGRSADKQTFGNKYTNQEMIEIRTDERITLREKVTAIKDKFGEYIWIELDFPTDTPTVWELVGTTPMMDPFGRTVMYNSLMKRSENQQIGL